MTADLRDTWRESAPEGALFTGVPGEGPARLGEARGAGPRRPREARGGACDAGSGAGRDDGAEAGGAEAGGAEAGGAAGGLPRFTSLEEFVAWQERVAGAHGATLATIEALEVHQRAVAALRLHAMAVLAALAEAAASVVWVPEEGISQVREQAGVLHAARRSAVAEVATRTRASTGQVASEWDLARQVTCEHPGAVKDLAAGALSGQHLRVIAEESAVVPVEHREGFGRMLAARARGCTPAQLRVWARRRRELDLPGSLGERHRAARAGRFVELAPGRDGMAWVSAHLPKVAAVAVFDRVTAAALACRGRGEQRSLAQLRADALVDYVLAEAPLPGPGAGPDAGSGAGAAASPDAGAGASPGALVGATFGGRVRVEGAPDGVATLDVEVPTPPRRRPPGFGAAPGVAHSRREDPREHAERRADEASLACDESRANEESQASMESRARTGSRAGEVPLVHLDPRAGEDHGRRIGRGSSVELGGERDTDGTADQSRGTVLPADRDTGPTTAEEHDVGVVRGDAQRPDSDRCHSPLNDLAPPAGVSAATSTPQPDSASEQTQGTEAVPERVPEQEQLPETGQVPETGQRGAAPTAAGTATAPGAAADRVERMSAASGSQSPGSPGGAAVPFEESGRGMLARTPLERRIAVASHLADADDVRNVMSPACDADIFGVRPSVAVTVPHTLLLAAAAATDDDVDADAHAGTGTAHARFTTSGDSSSPAHGASAGHPVEREPARTGVAEVVGHGPIDDATALKLVAAAPSLRRILTDPHSGIALDMSRGTYVVPVPLRALLALRDVTCRFPGCRQPAVRCDVDHVVDWAAGGVTSVDNLVHLCRMHHRLKHTSAWRSQVLTDTELADLDPDALDGHPEIIELVTEARARAGGWTSIRADDRSDGQVDTRADNRADIRTDIGTDIRTDGRPEVRAEVRADLRADLRADTRAGGQADEPTATLAAGRAEPGDIGPTALALGRRVPRRLAPSVVRWTDPHGAVTYTVGELRPGRTGPEHATRIPEDAIRDEDRTADTQDQAANTPPPY